VQITRCLEGRRKGATDATGATSPRADADLDQSSAVDHAIPIKRLKQIVMADQFPRARGTPSGARRANPISLNSTSKHIRMLEGAGLVRRDVRGREHILSLNAEPLAGAAEWIKHYRRFWSDQLASLDRFVTTREAGKESK